MEEFTNSFIIPIINNKTPKPIKLANKIIKGELMLLRYKNWFPKIEQDVWIAPKCNGYWKC